MTRIGIIGTGFIAQGLASLLETRRDLRPSRLVRSVASYVRRSMITMLRILIIYRSFPFFLSIGSLLFLSGAALGARFLYYYLYGQGGGLQNPLATILRQQDSLKLTAKQADSIASINRFSSLPFG